MPRRLRHSLQGTVFHVYNRAARRATIFAVPADYDAFLRVVKEGLSKSSVATIAYCVMPNHWHFVMSCDRIAHLSKLMHWITGTHAQRWNVAHGMRRTGSVYQGRFSALPVQTERYFFNVCRYVEANAFRSRLVPVAEKWPWSSLAADREYLQSISLAPGPILRPQDWNQIVNTPDNEENLRALRQMIRRNQPIGEPDWQRAVAPFCGLSLRPIGRQPKKLDR
jgi:putative transposase